FAVEDIILYNNEKGQIHTERRTMKNSGRTLSYESFIFCFEELLMSVWRKSVDKFMAYYYELHTVNATLNLDEDVEMDYI
ncbi:hypothetical protein CU098_012299, partial [Rhizopus stolonifer]